MANPGIDNSPIKRVVQVDVNGNPVYASGSTTSLISDTMTLNANNATAAVPIFGVTGVVEVMRLWGVVTTDLGSNVTASFWRLNDQTAQLNITLNTGTILSSLKAGSWIVKKDLAATALTKKDNAAGALSEPTTLETMIWSPIVIVKKTAATTNIEFVYTTTNTPTSGVIQFFAEYRALSADGLLTSL